MNGENSCTKGVDVIRIKSLRSKEMKRLGIFGGTFNPIHYGHLRVAVEIQELFSLDRVIFIPSAQPPHKDFSHIAHALDRLKMTEIAVNPYPLFQTSDIEIQRKGLSYTIDTIQGLRNVYPEIEQFYYLIGWDAFLAIHTWKQYHKLFDEIPFIVMSRPVEGSQKNFTSMIQDTLVHYIQQNISKEYCHDKQQLCIKHPKKKCIYYCQVTSLDISASYIRYLIEKNRSIRFLLPEAVENYINNNKIYR
ncbi:putative nicotinate-nucleotide adenylyltransferase [Candidatus Magnetomorum sp. HK-1]|nr:putative nicotinate-nucleotide adenylyltransferase [Candidatus Magnetomorum sp. HK-1]